MLQDGVECESFMIISIVPLPVHENKYYPQVHWDICAYKIVDKQMIDYLENQLFDSDEN